MKCALNLAICTLHATLALWIVFGLHLHNVAIGVFGAPCTLHDVGTFQAYFLARCHPKELLGRVFHKVFAFHPQISREGDGVRSVGCVFGIIHRFQFFGLPFGIVCNHQLNGINHRCYATSTLVEVFAYRGFKQGHVVKCVELGVANRIDEHANAFRRISSAAHTA